MLCFQCGGPLEGNESKCPNCGANLKKVSRRIELPASDGLQKYTQKLRAISADDRRLFPEDELLADRYVLGALIGRGPFGQVYEANDRELEVTVALKVFQKDVFDSHKARGTFEAQVKSARKLDHKNIVRVMENGVHEGCVWVAMQHLEGLTLRKLMKLRASKDEVFDRDEIIRLVEQVAEAFASVARTHGNLKPENIIFLPDVLKVTDHFIVAGTARDVVSKRLADSDYLAPEIARRSGKSASKPAAASDVYSLGAITSEMLFGKTSPPAPDDPRFEEDESLAALAEVCHKALSRSSKKRFDSLAAFRDAFIAAAAPVEEEEPAATPPVPVLTSPPPAPASDAPEVKAEAPPAAPPTPPPAAPVAKADAEVEASEALDELPEEEIATVEVSRAKSKSPEMLDLLPTNEVERGQIPVEKGPKLESSKAAASMSAPKPTPTSESSGIPTWAVLVGIVAIAVIIAAVMISKKQKPEVVTIGDENTIANTTPVAGGTTPAATSVAAVDMGAGKDAGVAADPKMVAALDAASNKQHEAIATSLQASAATAQNAADMGGDSPDAGAAATTPAVAVKDGGKTDTNTSDKSSQGSKTKVDSSSKDPDPKKAVGAGTKCPQGMALVKSKKAGNVCVDRYEYPGRGKTPKTRVSWFDAKKTCESSGKRLCARNEWTRACGGRYPYRGKKYDPNKCNTADEDGFERSIKAAGSTKTCRSGSGAYDMVGNVFEWTAEKRIVGGSFNSGEGVAKCGYSSGKSPSSSSSDIGFRCCATPN